MVGDNSEGRNDDAARLHCHYQPILLSSAEDVCCSDILSSGLGTAAVSLVGYFPDMINCVHKGEMKISDMSTQEKEESILSRLLTDGSNSKFEEALDRLGSMKFSGHIFDFMILRTISMLSHCFNDGCNDLFEKYSDWLATLQLGASALLHYNGKLGGSFFEACAKQFQSIRLPGPQKPVRFPDTLSAHYDKEQNHLVEQYIIGMQTIKPQQTIESSRLHQYKSGEYRARCVAGRNIRQLKREGKLTVFPDDRFAFFNPEKEPNNTLAGLARLINERSPCQMLKPKLKKNPSKLNTFYPSKQQQKNHMKALKNRQEIENEVWQKMADNRDAAKKAAIPIHVWGDMRILMNLTMAFLNTICRDGRVNQEYRQRCETLKRVILERLDYQQTQTKTSDAAKLLYSLIQWSNKRKETPSTALLVPKVTISTDVMDDEPQSPDVIGTKATTNSDARSLRLFAKSNNGSTSNIAQRPTTTTAHSSLLSLSTQHHQPSMTEQSNSRLSWPRGRDMSKIQMRVSSLTTPQSIQQHIPIRHVSSTTSLPERQHPPISLKPQLDNRTSFVSPAPVQHRRFPSTTSLRSQLEEQRSLVWAARHERQFSSTRSFQSHSNSLVSATSVSGQQLRSASRHGGMQYEGSSSLHGDNVSSQEIFGLIRCLQQGLDALTERLVESSAAAISPKIDQSSSNHDYKHAPYTSGKTIPTDINTTGVNQMQNVDSIASAMLSNSRS